MSGRFALIIGNTEYADPGLAQLTAPGKDADDFARVLKEKSICAFDDVTVLLNQSSSSVIEAIDEFFDQKKPDDLIVLYFSGHGVRDELGALYLAVKNTNRFRLRSTAIKSDFIREAMDQSRSKRQVLIMDCCNSGAFAQGTKAATGVSIGTATAFEAGYGRIILTASDSTQFAWEGDKVIGETDNSLFTHYLVEGLEGEADLDGDGRITVDEVYDYAYEKVRLATPKQTPSKFSSKQQGEIVLRQSMRLEDIKPVSLPGELIEEIEDTRPYVREAAFQKLEKIVKGRNIGLARSARDALEKLAIDDNTTRRVAQMATQLLESIRQAERAEEERKPREEAERLADLKAKEDRLAREKAEAERIAKEETKRLQAQQKAEEEAKRLAALKADEERLAREKAEAEQKAKDEAQRFLAEQKAEEERRARMEAERLAVLKAEEERFAREKAEAEQKTEEERIAKAKLDADRLAAEKLHAAETTKVVPEKTVRPQSARQQRSILKWAIIGSIVLCGLATGTLGASYLFSLIAKTPTSTPTMLASITEPSLASVPTQTSLASVPTQENPSPTQETYNDPFAYCTAIGTIDAPDARYAGPLISDEIIDGYKAAAGITASTDTESTEYFKKTTIWRCMDNQVYACNFGANLACDSKANTDQTPSLAMEEWCKANPDDDFIPLFVTGHDTIYSWHCVKDAVEVLEQIAEVDAAGYLANIWYPITPATSPSSVP